MRRLPRRCAQRAGIPSGCRRASTCSLCLPPFGSPLGRCSLGTEGGCLGKLFKCAFRDRLHYTLSMLHFSETLKGNAIVVDGTDLLRWSGWSCQVIRNPNCDFWFRYGALDSNSPKDIREGAEFSRVKGQESDHRDGRQGQTAVPTHRPSTSSPEKPTSQQPLLHLSPNSRRSSSQIQHRATRGRRRPSHHGVTHRYRRFRNPSGGKGGQILLQWDTKDLTSLSRRCSGYCSLTAKSLSPPSHTSSMVIILAHCCWASCKANGQVLLENTSNSY